VPQVTGLERAVFGDVSTDEIRAWLGRHLRSRLHMDVNDVVFTSGRVAPVYGLRLQDGSTVVLKIHRSPVNSNRLAAASRCQRLLAEAGFPCPVPLDGPAPTEGRIATIESFLDHGHPGNGHNPPVRRSLAASLAAQVDALRGVTDSSLVTDAPAWARYQDGPWPEPHDPIFDFSTLPDERRWLDQLAREAADVLATQPPEPTVIGHSDWACQNVRFAGDEVVASFDWDSLVARPEPVIAGLSAGGFPEGGGYGAAAPTPDEAGAYLADYDSSRSRPFTRAEQAAAAAAAAWVLSYNARCTVDLEHRGLLQPEEGSPLQLLDRYRRSYLELRW
jgi:Ser/Thr protein kinase RdoA (MazF antagonist)